MSNERKTEAQLSERISVLQNELQSLYALRRGQMILARPDDVEDPVFGWCVGCGQRQVCVSEGFDTCSLCVELS